MRSTSAIPCGLPRRSWGAFRHGAANCVFEMFYEIFGYRPCTGCPFYKDGHCRNNEVETIVGWLESEAAE